MTAPKPLPRTDYPSTTDPEARAAYAAGLRHLADVIASDPDCPYPQGPIALFIHDGENQAEIAARLRRSLGGGRWQKKESVGGAYLTLDGMCGGVPVDLWLDRDAVCERVVTGTEEVTEVIPAVTEADLRPEQTVTRTVEHVEWVCSPLLANDAEDADQIEVAA
jgi:hypothetical protein